MVQAERSDRVDPAESCPAAYQGVVVHRDRVGACQAEARRGVEEVPRRVEVDQKEGAVSLEEDQAVDPSVAEAFPLGVDAAITDRHRLASRRVGVEICELIGIRVGAVSGHAVPGCARPDVLCWNVLPGWLVGIPRSSAGWAVVTRGAGRLIHGRKTRIGNCGRTRSTIGCCVVGHDSLPVKLEAHVVAGHFVTPHRGGFARSSDHAAQDRIR